VKEEEIEILVKHRIEQAWEALNDAKYLKLSSNRSNSKVQRKIEFFSVNSTEKAGKFQDFKIWQKSKDLENFCLTP